MNPAICGVNVFCFFSPSFLENAKFKISKINGYIAIKIGNITILGFITIITVSKIIKDRMSKKAMLCDLEIFYKGKVRKIKTMIDTGNLLKEPISKKDVIIVEKSR